MHRAKRASTSLAGASSSLALNPATGPTISQQLFSTAGIFRSAASTRSSFATPLINSLKGKTPRSKALSFKKFEKPNARRKYNTGTTQPAVEPIPETPPGNEFVKNKIYLFIDNCVSEGEHYAFWLNWIYPVKRNRVDIRAWLVGNYERKIHSVFPPDAQIELMQRVIKEGGVYAHFVTEAGNVS